MERGDRYGEMAQVQGALVESGGRGLLFHTHLVSVGEGLSGPAQFVPSVEQQLGRVATLFFLKGGGEGSRGGKEMMYRHLWEWVGIKTGEERARMNVSRAGSILYRVTKGWS